MPPKTYREIYEAQGNHTVYTPLETRTKEEERVTFHVDVQPGHTVELPGGGWAFVADKEPWKMDVETNAYPTTGEPSIKEEKEQPKQYEEVIPL